MSLRADRGIGFVVLLKVFFGLILTFQVYFNFFWSVSVSIHKKVSLTCTWVHKKLCLCAADTIQNKSQSPYCLFRRGQKRHWDSDYASVSKSKSKQFIPPWQWATQNVAERECVVIFKEQFLRAWFWSEARSLADTNLHQSEWRYIALNKRSTWTGYCTDPLMEETLL